MRAPPKLLFLACWLPLAIAGPVCAQTVATRTQVDWREAYTGTYSAKTEPWKKKPYTAWDEKDLREIAFFSPWAFSVKIAKAQKIPVEIGGGTEPVYVPAQTLRGPNGSTIEVPGRMVQPPEQRTVMREPRVMVRWLSSRIMRELAARAKQITETEARGLIDAKPQYHEILVTGAYAATMREACTIPVEECLRDSVTLRPHHTKTELRPARVEFRAIKNENERPEVSFFFDKTASGSSTIGSNEKKVTFRWNSPAGIVEAVFNLLEMKRNGTPDI